MTFEDQFELGKLLRSGRAMTFTAIEKPSQQDVFVHFFVAGHLNQTDLWGEVRDRIARFEAAGTPCPLRSGEKEGSPFVVSPAESQFQDLASWLRLPAPSVPAGPRPGEEASLGGAEPGEFTLLFADQASEPRQVDQAKNAQSPSPIAARLRTQQPASAEKTPSAQSSPTGEPGEFTLLFQGEEQQLAASQSAPSMGSQVTSPSPVPAPTAPEFPPRSVRPQPSSAGAGEFTRMFEAPVPTSDSAEGNRSEAIARPGIPDSAKVFEKLEGKTPLDDPGFKVPSPKPEHLMRAAADAPVRAESAYPPPAPPKLEPGRPPRMPERQSGSFSDSFPAASQMPEAGEFTQRLGSSRPDPAITDNPLCGRPSSSSIPERGDAPSKEPGEFTKLFQGDRPIYPTGPGPFEAGSGEPFHPLQSDLDDPLARKPSAGSSSQGGQFTKLFGSPNRDEQELGGPPGGYGYGPQTPGEDRASTEIFEARRSARPPVQSAPARPAEGDYTRTVKGGTPPVQPALAPVAPAPVAPRVSVRESKETRDSHTIYLILALIFSGLLVVALAIVLYFSASRSNEAVEPGPDAAVGPEASSGVPSSGPGVSATAPRVTAPSLSSGSVRAPSVSSGSISAPSVRAPSVSQPSVSSRSVTAPRVSAPSVGSGSAAAPAVATSASGNTRTPYLAIIIVLSVLLVWAVGAAVYVAVKRS